MARLTNVVVANSTKSVLDQSTHENRAHTSSIVHGRLGPMKTWRVWIQNRAHREFARPNSSALVGNLVLRSAEGGGRSTSVVGELDSMRDSNIGAPPRCAWWSTWNARLYTSRLSTHWMNCRRGLCSRKGSPTKP